MIIEADETSHLSGKFVRPYSLWKLQYKHNIFNFH
jgi:hypothetical protein